MGVKEEKGVKEEGDEASQRKEERNQMQ